MTQVDPTCTMEGSITCTCSSGHSYSDPIPSYGHSLCELKVLERPTMTKTGFGTRSCTVCAALIDIMLPKNTPEQEVQGFLNDYMMDLPYFQSTKDL